MPTYFTIQLIFATIHGSHFIISANFYLYLQYFQQNVFNFSKKFLVSAKWVDPKLTLNGDLQLLAITNYFWIVKFMMGTILTLKSNDVATASLCICLVELFQILLVHQTDPTAIHNRVLMRTLKYNLNLTAFNVLNSSKPIITRQKKYPNVGWLRKISEV